MPLPGDPEIVNVMYTICIIYQLHCIHYFIQLFVPHAVSNTTNERLAKQSGCGQRKKSSVSQLLNKKRNLRGLFSSQLKIKILIRYMDCDLLIVSVQVV